MRRKKIPIHFVQLKLYHQFISRSHIQIHSRIASIRNKFGEIMTEVIEPTAIDQISPAMQNDGDEDTDSISGESDSSGFSIDESFSFSESYSRTFDAENESSISLLNLSISPITANPDDELAKDIFSHSDQHTYSGLGEDDDERIPLDEITAQINTPPPSHSKSATKRLNLETIFEGVFLETPPKKRKFESWRIRQVTTDERISSYVKEQQQTVDRCEGASNALCNLFDERIDIN